MTDRLDIWLYGLRVAHIETATDGRIRLDWTSDARDRWGEGTRVLSAKLPIGTQPVPALVRNYLDGLLPEGNARTNHAMTAGLAPDNTFGLIRAYGRDTTGAALFVEPGTGDPTRAGRYERIEIEEVSERLRYADVHSPARYGGVTGESSALPGMVPKIALHRDGPNWFACKDGAPSTWILKRAFPSDSGIGDIIDTEVACLALAGEVGLTTVQAEVIDFGTQRAIAVSRYDRQATGPDPRLHQEDLAQAIGLSTSDPNRKFQYGSQMPSLSHGAHVLRLDGGNPDRLLRLATFSHLVGNTDMHAKNISFLRLPDRRVTLAPAYDIAMHLHHPSDNRRSALDVNGRFLVSDITLDDLVQEGASWGLPKSRAARVVNQATRDLSLALDGIDRTLHPGVEDDAWDRVSERVFQATDPLASAPVRGHSRRRGPKRPRA